jgi:hypothetical protein
MNDRQADGGEQQMKARLISGSEQQMKDRITGSGEQHIKDRLTGGSEQQAMDKQIYSLRGIKCEGQVQWTVVNNSGRTALLGVVKNIWRTDSLNIIAKDRLKGDGDEQQMKCRLTDGGE